MFRPYKFSDVTLLGSAVRLRAEVREFLSDWQGTWTPSQLGIAWMGFDRDFSRALAAKGWIGMTWPKAYGGGEYTMLERYVVTEELLASGAPLGAHWVSDRQSGPLILKVGTETQKTKIVPEITRGEACFCIGLSEPDSGSDLASVRTRATPDGDGWRLNGRKIWTTNAHHSEYMIALVRTSGGAADRHSGLSQLIVPMDAPGIEIRQIKDLMGDAHFNEIVFDDVPLGPDALIGKEGEGWAQVTAELAFERSGPDRYLSAFPLFQKLLATTSGRPSDRLAQREIGMSFARMATLRSMSVSIAGMLQEGQMPNQEAAVVKDMGNDFEQQMPEIARAVIGSDASAHIDSDLAELQASVLQIAPVYSLRGGTREILRGIMAKGLGLK